MHLKFNNDKPIYLQLLQHFEQLILMGKWTAASPITSVRDLAALYKVNPNTVQRSLSELESKGLALTKKNQTRYVTDDESLIAELRDKRYQELLTKFITDCSNLGISLEQALTHLEQEQQRQNYQRQEPQKKETKLQANQSKNHQRQVQNQRSDEKQ